MIIPSIGRVVWYTPAKTQDGRGDAKQPYAAIVVYVHNDRCVNLAVFDHIGRPHPRLNTQLLQDEDTPKDTDGEGHAAWMPYQKAVAAGELPALAHAIAAPVATTPPAKA